MKRETNKQLSYVKLDTDGLTSLSAALKQDGNLFVKVGLLGPKSGRTASKGARSGLNNPTLGLIHEFGSISRNIPERSFLRVPILEGLPTVMANIGQATFDALIKGKGLRHALEVVGVECENLVQAAFATGGFGFWPKLKARTISRKGSSAILIDTAQLRKAVSSEVTS